MINLQSKTYSLLQFFVFFLLFSIAPTIQATIVAPGATVALTGTTNAANPDLGGTVQNDILIPFTILDGGGGTLISGNLQDRVVLSTNLGTLIFSPRIRDLTGVAGASIVGLQTTGYTSFSTDIEYRTDGLGTIGADDVSRSAGLGDTLDFSYNPSVITPPAEAFFLSVITDATIFGAGGTITISATDGAGNPFSVVLNNTVSPALAPVGPVTAVPLPAIVWVFSAGLISLIGLFGIKRYS